MQQIAINENELATRWGVSPKTLQRWRSEGRGPRYLKLSKRVSYPLDEIFLFEERDPFAEIGGRAAQVNGHIKHSALRYRTWGRPCFDALRRH